MMQARWVSIALSAFAFACGSEDPDLPTQIIVTVTSDLRIAEQLTHIEAQVRSGSGGGRYPSHVFALEKGEQDRVELPFSFGIERGVDRQFQLITRGLKGEELVVENRVFAAFEDQQTLGMSVFLGMTCVKKTCDADSTCFPIAMDGHKAGECGPTPDAELEPVDASSDGGIVDPGRGGADGGTAGNKPVAGRPAGGSGAGGMGGGGTVAGGRGGAGSPAGVGGAGTGGVGGAGTGGVGGGGRSGTGGVSAGTGGSSGTGGVSAGTGGSAGMCVQVNSGCAKPADCCGAVNNAQACVTGYCRYTCSVSSCPSGYYCVSTTKVCMPNPPPLDDGGVDAGN